MAKVNSKEVLKKADVNNVPMQAAAKQSVAGILQSMLDSEKLRPRFEELLGKRMPSFMGSLVSMINGNPALMKAFYDSPLSVMQSALKAAAYNLPIDPALGFAYVVPFWSSKTGKNEAQFILGYKGMIQLANRTGAYEKLNVVDVREGELKKFDRLTEDVEVEWIQDEVQREKLPVIGYLGYFRLVNGFEKKIYMSVSAIDAHEQKFRKGKNSKRPAIWNDNYDAMACKTVLRRMISKWGLMSIDYQRADAQTIQVAQDIAMNRMDDEEVIDTETVQDTPEQLPEEPATAQQTVPEWTVQKMFGAQIPEGEMVDF